MGGRCRWPARWNDLLAGHRVLVGPAADVARAEDRAPVVHRRVAGRQAHLLVRVNGGLQASLPEGWEAQPVGLEELVLAYLREPAARALPDLLPADPWAVRS